MKTNYVLVDFENVQPQDLASLKGGPFKIKVFLGSTQTKIATDIVLWMQSFQSNAEFIQIDGSGSNALDFHISFYIGELVTKDTTGVFYIISKDTGFDPLIRHLRSRKISIHRCPDTTHIPLPSQPDARLPAVKAPLDTLLEKRICLVLENLKKQTVRPTKTKTLRSFIHSLFHKQLTEQDLNVLVEELRWRKVITITDGKVSYRLHDILTTSSVAAGK